MWKLEFFQTNYIAKDEEWHEIKICPFCKTSFSTVFDDCPNCKSFLPSFPTSWVRSATNIFLLRKVLEYVFFYLGWHCSPWSLTDLLTLNYIISFDPQRKDNQKYWRWWPMRRASEYLSNLQFLGFIIKRDDWNFYITSQWKELVLAKDYKDYISLRIKSFMELKIWNQYDLKWFYSAYNNHLLYSAIKIIKDLNERWVTATIENMALAIMCKNETTEYKKALDVSLKFWHKYIRQFRFWDTQEFKRVVRWVFVRWLSQVKLLDIEVKESTIFLKLTSLWNEIINKYEKIYKADLEKQTDTDTNEIKNIISNNIEEKYLKINISSEYNNRTWADREATVKDNFNKIWINVDWYKKSLDFANIQLPDDVLISLTWWTRYNPDLILKNPLWLIDPKKDVNAEMHKVYAYDKYWAIVNWLSIIVTQKIMKEEKVKMMKNLSLKNVFVLDWYALQVLSDNPDYFSKEKVISILNNCKNNIYYLNEEELFNKYVN